MISGDVVELWVVESCFCFFDELVYFGDNDGNGRQTIGLDVLEGAKSGRWCAPFGGLACGGCGGLCRSW